MPVSRPLVTTLVAFLVILSLPLPQGPLEAESLDYAYPLVFRYRFNFTITDVLALNSTSIVLVVDYGTHSAVAVASLRDPIGGPEIVQLYPLVGRVTATAVDGYPPTRFAVGSDRGEVYLFKIDGGRLHQLLHLIQGADFRVLSLFVARSAGGCKLIATVSEGYPTGLCTSCYVYVFDENTLGALVISPHISTTTAGYYRRLYPQIAVPARVYTPGGYYYRADSVALFWAPYIDAVEADLNISYYVNATVVRPAQGALIEVSIVDPVTRARRVYGWNADDRGRALVPIPKGYLANITVIGSTRRFLIRENVNTSAIARRFRVEVTIPERVSTDSAEDVYGLPFFAKYFIDFLDLTNAPTSYRAVKSLDKEFYPTVGRPHFIDYGGGYAIVLLNRTYLEVYNVDYTYALQPSGPVAVEYVGMLPISIVDVVAYSKSDLVVGFSDGRVKHYVFNALRNKYDFAQAITTLGSLVRILPAASYSYFTFSTRGVQVVVLTPYQLPLLRIGFQAEFAVEGLVSASSLPDARLLALVSQSELYVVTNLGAALAEARPISLHDYFAPSLVVRLLPPAAHERINGSVVLLRYELEGLSRELVKVYVKDNVTFTNILPNKNYSVVVIPSRDYILNYSSSIEVPHCKERCASTVVTCNLSYRDYVLKLVVQDEFGGAPLGRLSVTIDGKPYEYKVPEGLAVRLLYGTHEIRIESPQGYYQSYQDKVMVEADSELSVVLRRVRYNLTLLLLDGLTGKPAGPGLAVYVNGTAYTPSQNGTVSAVVPSGAADIRVVPLQELSKVYREYVGTVDVSKSLVLAIPMSRVTYNLRVSALDELTRRETAMVAGVTINGTEVYRGPLPTVLELPYAHYSLGIVPLEGYAALYSPGFLELTLDSNTTAQVLVFRNVYTLELTLRDRYSERPVVPLKVLINGSLYATTTSSRIALPLRAASYVVRVEPVDEHPASYEPVETSLKLSLIHISEPTRPY